MEYNIDIDDIPIQIEGVTDTSLPGTSAEIGQNIKAEDKNSDDDAESEDEKPKIRKDMNKLSPHLKGLMGEANVRYARGDIETSKKMCFEVIRQAPDAHEPYLTLSQIYENSNPKKQKGYLMLASHLAPTDIGLLCRLADLHIQEGEIDLAIKCYSRGLKYHVRNLFLHEKRLELLEKTDKKAKLIAKHTLAKHVSRKHHELILKVSMETAEEYFKEKNHFRAVEVLMVPFVRIPDKITYDAVNMLLELLILCERYSDCLDIFTQFCGFSFDITLTPENVIIVNSFEKPDDLHVDLKFKFVICLVRLRAEHLFSDLINNILIDDDVEQVGDLYLDVVEALMCMSYPYEALKLLVPLVKSKAFATAAVWLKYAECLKLCNMSDQAIEAYFTVMSMAPSHVEVLYPLAMLLLQQNKKKEALEVMSQDTSSNRLDVAVLLEQMKLLKQINDWPNYWKCVELLLSRHCINLKYPEEFKWVATSQHFNEKVTRIQKMRIFRNDDADEVLTQFICLQEPSVEEEYSIYKNILQLALDKREYSVLKKIAFMGLGSKRFQPYFREIYIFALYSCVLLRDIYHGYTLVREVLTRNPKNELAWNWFIIVTSAPEEMRHVRFLAKYSQKFSVESRQMVAANNNLSIGNYIQALNLFVKEHKKTETFYTAFMMAVSMLQYYQRKLEKENKKYIAETITYLFFHYSKLRTKSAEQEVYYNFGRMYQQLGFMYLAEHYYKMVFKVNNKYLEMYPEIVCLKREAAFNLHLIYRNSGNLVQARNILYKYITV